MTALARSTLPVLNVLGYVVLMFAVTLLVPLAFAVVGDDGAQRSFDIALLVTAGCGLASGAGDATRYRRELQVRDGFLLVTLAWTVLPAFGDFAADAAASESRISPTRTSRRCRG